MKKFLNFLAVTTAALLVSWCAGSSSSIDMDNSEADTKKPVNCSTAETDIRVLKSEKDRVKEQTVSGIFAYTPVGLAVNTVTSSSDSSSKVSAEEYNKMLDDRIAVIQKTCGLKYLGKLHMSKTL